MGVGLRHEDQNRAGGETAEGLTHMGLTTAKPCGLGEPGGLVYSASVQAHSETVLRSFYDFHRDAGSGPVLNPFPLDRSRRGGRAHAHHNPMEPHRDERSGRYRPKVASRVPRAVPDDEFNEIFARLPSQSARRTDAPAHRS